MVDQNDFGFSSWTFYLQNAHFYSGGTRIRTGDTMIFSHIQKPLGMRKTRVGKRIYVQRVPLDTDSFCSYCCATVDRAIVASTGQISDANARIDQMLRH